MILQNVVSLCSFAFYWFARTQLSNDHDWIPSAHIKYLLFKNLQCLWSWYIFKWEIIIMNDKHISPQFKRASGSRGKTQISVTWESIAFRGEALSLSADWHSHCCDNSLGVWQQDDCTMDWNYQYLPLPQRHFTLWWHSFTFIQFCSRRTFCCLSEILMWLLSHLDIDAYTHSSHWNEGKDGSATL